jgi:hypothetical protein
MVSINECKKVLANDNKQYSEDEIIQIRDFMYQLANIELKMRNDYE